MPPVRSYKQRSSRELAPVKEEVLRLFAEAKAFHDAGKKEYARRRVTAARRRMMKVQLRVPELEGKYCRACNAYLEAGVNATTRLKNSIMIRRCNECGAVRRRPVGVPRRLKEKL